MKRILKTNYSYVVTMLVLMFTVMFLALSCDKGDGPAGKWKFVGNIKDENARFIDVYIDLDNIEIHDNIRKFWVKYIAQKGETKEEGTYIRQTGFWEVNCNDRTLYRLAEEYYNPNSVLLGRTEEKMREDFSSEDSLGAKMGAAACRYAGR